MNEVPSLTSLKYMNPRVELKILMIYGWVVCVMVPLYMLRCKDEKCQNKKGSLPANPGKHADPPDKTTVLNQSLPLANSAE
jgi:hypothetical protein